MENVILIVKGMSCGHCVNSIEGNVGKLNGVHVVKVYLNDEKVDVSFDSKMIALKEITDVIEDQGYDVALSKSAKDQNCH
ncbi:copper chaperone CopZ [Cytobacillus oceanisediminis]|uniref:copper chaperone CopZ n=1 Tax=Cytobacillus oceanisediminis TaxID=665099 RepID=UPI0023DC4ABC|nr:copper chaperone CopZ [Cytobacillus oceanisediminis]MDF2036428.1 copper chaperone CopZ [Cytobacillus oceanisediminis]